MDDDSRVITRRDILRRVGAAGAAAVTLPAGLAALPKIPADDDVARADHTAQGVPPAPPAPAGAAVSAPVREAFENLTATEADLLEAVVERLIPRDEHGPGARDARVAHFIDRALGSALASSRSAYDAGLDALDRFAKASRGKPFLQLSPADQDAVLAACEAGTATGFPGGSVAFFTMVLTHTRQGMFGDPYYGGNAGFAGWDLLGYPGVRTMVSASDQQALEAGTLKPVRRSTYDYDGFNKAAVGAPADPDMRHGH